MKIIIIIYLRATTKSIWLKIEQTLKCRQQNYILTPQKFFLFLIINNNISQLAYNAHTSSINSEI